MRIRVLMMFVFARGLNPIGKDMLVFSVFLTQMFQHAIAIARPKNERSHRKCQKLFEDLLHSFYFRQMYIKMLCNRVSEWQNDNSYLNWNYLNRNVCALMATIIVLKLINTAPMAGEITIPGTKPVAKGNVIAL